MNRTCNKPPCFRSLLYISISVLLALFIAALCILAAPNGVQAGARASVYGVRMEPEGSDAEDFSKASWGGGLNVVLAPPGSSFFAGVLGFDVVNMLSQTVEFRDSVTLLRVEQQTHQYYTRFYVGGMLGHQGHGFFRPHVGANVALVYYSISTDVVVPDDDIREKEIRQHLEKQGHAVFGYDFTAGIELRFTQLFYADAGARYIKSFSVPQQLGEDSVKIHPQYIQMYIGFGMIFDL